jgi:AraC family transcriptional activator of pobA
VSAPLHEVRFQRPDGREVGLETLRLEALLSRRMALDLSEPQRMHFHQMIFVEGGISHHVVDFEPLPVGPATFAVVRAGQTQAFAPEKVLRGRMVVFTPAFLQSLPDPGGRLANACGRLLWGGATLGFGPGSAAEAIRAFEALEHLDRAPVRPYLEDAVAAAFSALVFALAGLEEVVRRQAEGDARDPVVTRFLALLESSFRAQRSAAFYARKLHVSVRTLDRRVHLATGGTAKAAITARTLLEARRLLTQRDLQVKAIAEDLGFSVPQNFTRFFRQGTGQTPEAFRVRGGRPTSAPAPSPGSAPPGTQ